MAGIGGKTIAQAKHNLSYVEVQKWKAYRDLTGSFNLGTRIEQGVALLATCIVNGNGGKTDISDFIPDRGGREIPEAKPEDLLALLNSLVG